MQAVKLRAQVTADHTLQLQLPEEIAEGPVEVIILAEESQGSQPLHKTASIAEFLTSTQKTPKSVRSKEEIDAYLRAERDSWE